VNFNLPPVDAKSILAMHWADYEPYYAELEKRSLDENNVDEWLADWSMLAQTVDQYYWVLYFDTTLNTVDVEIDQCYNRYTTLPFYYVEYDLAQLGAVLVFGSARRGQKKTVADYRKALALGATVPVPELFALAGAKFGLATQTLKEAVDLVEEVITELEAKYKL